MIRGVASLVEKEKTLFFKFYEQINCILNESAQQNNRNY
jgi:hypothetical protein